MTFEEFTAAIQAKAEACGATDPGKPYCDPEAWRDAFVEGATVDEVWQGECDAAADMMG